MSYMRLSMLCALCLSWSLVHAMDQQQIILAQKPDLEMSYQDGEELSNIILPAQKSSLRRVGFGIKTIARTGCDLTTPLGSTLCSLCLILGTYIQVRWCASDAVYCSSSDIALYTTLTAGSGWITYQSGKKLAKQLRQINLLARSEKDL